MEQYNKYLKAVYGDITYLSELTPPFCGDGKNGDLAKERG